MMNFASNDEAVSRAEPISASRASTETGAPRGVNAVRIERLYVSAGHNFFGHHDRPPGTHATEERAEILCVAGRGIEGDRFFDHKPDYAGQITFFAGEVFDELSAQLGLGGGQTPAVLRRNVITRGMELSEWYGREFELQGVRFLGVGECKPCYWMDRALGAGAEQWLRGRGGLRAKIVTGGRLLVEGVKV